MPSAGGKSRSLVVEKIVKAGDWDSEVRKQGVRRSCLFVALSESPARFQVSQVQGLCCLHKVQPGPSLAIGSQLGSELMD